MQNIYDSKFAVLAILNVHFSSILYHKFEQITTTISKTRSTIPTEALWPLYFLSTFPPAPGNL